MQSKRSFCALYLLKYRTKDEAIPKQVKHMIFDTGVSILVFFSVSSQETEFTLYSLMQHVCLHVFSTVQQCPDPGEVVNGARSVRPEAFFAVGTVVRFSCNEGYQLEGPSQISCHGRDTGTPKWSDRSPKCVCKSRSYAIRINALIAIN